MKRNLRFWSRYAWEGTYVELAVAAAVAFISILGADQFEWQNLAAVVPYYLLIAGVLCNIMVNLGCQQVYLPLLISFGETRKNVFLGYQYARFLIVSVMVLLSAVIWLLVPGEVSTSGLKSLLSIFLILVSATCLGSILGTVWAKWKWVAIIVIVIVCGGFGGVFGFMVAGGAREILSTASTLELSRFLEGVHWQLAAAAAGLLLLDLIFHWALLRKQEVKL